VSSIGTGNWNRRLLWDQPGADNPYRCCLPHAHCGEAMPLRIDPSLPHSPPLTLNRIMALIAALALGFAFLPMLLSMAFAVTVVGILVLQGLRLPLITEGGGVRSWLPWVLWSLALATCPIATAVVGIVYEHTGPPAFSGPRPWAARVVDGLGFAHLGVSVVASVAVVVLTRGGYRWLAWAAILTMGVFAALLLLGATMATTGIYL
jgi:hypothetical protein